MYIQRIYSINNNVKKEKNEKNKFVTKRGLEDQL